MTRARIDTDKLLQGVDLVALVGRYVTLKKDGKEWKGCCPFHQERTPSFYVSPEKGFVHCFGCGEHHNAIGFLMRYEQIDFVTACEKLGHVEFQADLSRKPEQAAGMPTSGRWRPLLPVPDDAPELVRSDGWTVPIWNPKRERSSRFKPTRADAYRNADGALLGYVLRCEFGDGKITPCVTWCIGPAGTMQWCIVPFPAPRPLYGLDGLADRPQAPVLLLEGEKCRAAGAGALPMYACASWPGGCKGVAHVDWSPLSGRDVVLWPDADDEGRRGMLGYRDYSGRFTPGVAQYLHAAGVRSMRLIDTGGQPKGWDIADALAEGWTPRQLATWAAHRVVDIEMVGA